MMPDTDTMSAPSNAAPAPSAAPSSGSSAPSSSPPAQSAAPNPAAPAQSSGAATAAPEAPKGPLSPQDVQTQMREVAKAALAKGKGNPSAPTNQGQPSTDKANANPSKPDAETAEGDDDAGADDGQLPEIDENSLPFDQRQIMRRWKRTLDRTRDQLKAAQPHAEQYQKILGYMDQFQLSAEQVATGFDVMAKLNTNPQLAYAALKPIMEQLETMIGERLPDDLQKRVEQGLTDEATARELSRQRGFTSTATHLNQQQAEQQQRIASQQLQQAVHSAVSEWETRRTEKDPDFPRKRPMIEDAARAIMAKEGIANTPAKAIDVLTRAAKLVEDRISPFRAGNGMPTPRQPSSASAPLANGAAPQPTNLRDAALQGLNGTYRF